MSLNIITRALSRALGGSLVTRHRVTAALLSAAAMLLATAGSAAAYPPTPLALNTPTWSGNVCCGASSPGWYKDAFGIIHLQGAVTQTVSGGSPLIAMLPPAARPNREVFTIVHTFGGTFADLAIAPNGQIGVITPRQPEPHDFSFVSLEGITYQPANQLPTTPIEINQTNWIQTWQPPNNSFGAANPTWYKDGEGIVHLEGATKQWNATPGGNSLPSLIGAVPPAAAPTRAITTVVHTAFGTHADLFITPNGQIAISGPQPPAFTDFSFVSLEGVSYNPGTLFNHVGNLNVNNWSPCCGSATDPGWVQDNAGIVHLQGEVNQTTSSGPNANLVATLPASIAPTRSVYTIAKMSSGYGYADLAVAPDGGIRVIDPTLLSSQHLIALLSLDGITYQPSSTVGPHGFSLTPSGEVLALLHKPRALELLVFKLGPRAHRLGAVKLGRAPAGRSRRHWDLRVASRRLRAGTYLAELAAVRAPGSTTSGPGVTFAVTRTGHLRVDSSTCSVAEAAVNRC